jgi:hypothetical protein
VSRRRNRSRGRRDRRQNYTRPQNGGPAGTSSSGPVTAQGSGDSVLDRHEVERQNALQVNEAAERAGAIVEDQIESIMEQAEAGAEAVRRNAEHDAANIRQEASASAQRVIERVEGLNGALGELAAELKREVEAMHAGAEERARDPEQAGAPEQAGDAEQQET